MKSLLLFCTLFSTTVFARQMYQCNITDTSSTDVMVVNLETLKSGTLFLSSGMQNPEDERILVKIAFDKIEGDKHIFKVINEQGTGSVAIPSNSLGNASNYVVIDLTFKDYSFDYACFTRIYE